MNIPYILGVDGGGTKTIARLENKVTGERFEAKAGPCSLTNNFALACANLKQVIDELLTLANAAPSQVVAVLGIAGAGNELQQQRLKRSLSYSFSYLEICNDAKTSLYGVNLGKPAVVIALGTGSVGAKLLVDNSIHYFSGWGFMISDDEGGAKLGLSAVKQLVNEIDTHQQATSELSKVIYQSFNNDNNLLLDWLKEAKAVDYAKFTHQIFALYDKCATSKQLVDNHIVKVFELIKRSKGDDDLPVFLTGGLASPLQQHMNLDQSQQLTAPKGNSLDGACLLALNHLKNAALMPHITQSQKVAVDEGLSLLKQLDTMVSEERNPNTMELDLMDSMHILQKLNEEDANVPKAISHCLVPISQTVDLVVNAFKNGGRLIYIGAGTSGRLGILDAVECPPTFGVSHELVVGIIAGGNKAIHKAVEGAEDNPALAIDDLKAINFCNKDVVVGIAASGRTPYVIGALDYAKSIGAASACVTCNPNAEIANHTEISICPVVGPEVLTGSTRLKSGTAQKLVLNMITTAAMVRSGKSYENLMVDVNASNEKLYARAIRIVMQATCCDETTAENALKITDFKAKPAILHVLTELPFEQCKKLLDENEGFLRKAVQAHQINHRAK